jgi:alpha-tubulin suppressor-like RCC1 family protein
VPFAPITLGVSSPRASRQRPSRLRATAGISALAVLVTLLLAPSVANALPTPTSGPEAGGTTVTVPVPGPESFIRIATGDSHSLAIDSDGNLWAWGSDNDGQIGNGATTGNITAPQQVSTDTTYIAIAAGGYYSLALDADGNLWTWGSDSYGQLGNGSASAPDVTTPTQVSAGTTYTAIAAGYGHSLAIDTDGNLWTWGWDGNGQLGNGGASGANVTTPTQIVSGTTYTTVTAGFGHSLAIDTDGNLWTWGSDSYGQLGNGSASATDITTPTQVSSGTVHTTIAAGGSHSLAIDTDGDLWAWGWDLYGQLGNGSVSAADVTTPTQVSTGTTYTAIAGGSIHSLAIDTSGNLWAWGFNNNGQLGNGTASAVNVTTPTQVSTGTTYIAIAAGHHHSLALDADGKLWAWGLDSSGQIGNGSATANVTSPEKISYATYGAISAGWNHSLSLDAGGNLWAWGHDDHGQLGNGSASAADITTPTRVSSGTTYTAIAAGSTHSLALDSNGNVWAWGWDVYGQLGNGNASAADVTAPAQITTGTTYTAITAGAIHSLAIDSDGNLWAWGWGGAGRVGNGATTGNVTTPTQVSTGTTYTAIAAGHTHSLAIDSDGELWAWGYDGNGQLGNGSTSIDDITTPTQLSTGTTWTEITAGNNYSLALDAGGNIWAWGAASYGQLGNGASAGNITTPLQVSTGTVYTTVAAGTYHSLALDAGGNMWAWGYDDYGQVGNGSASAANVTVPEQTSTGTVYAAIAAGNYHSVAVDSNGNLWAWGYDARGQVGNGTPTADITTPTRLLETFTVITRIAFDGTAGTNLTRLSNTSAQATTPAGSAGPATITITYTDSYDGTIRPTLTLSQTFTYIAATPSSGGSGSSSTGSSSGSSSGSNATTSGTAPEITLQPVNTTATAGDTVTLTVDADGNPAPIVQWQQSTDNGTTWTTIDGETDWTLTFTATDAMTGTLYRAIATNDTGDTTSDTITLTVLTAATSTPTTTPTATPTPDTEDTTATVPLWIWAIVAAIILTLITLGIILFRRRL